MTMNSEFEKYIGILAKVSTINILGMFLLNGIGFANNMIFAKVLGVENYGRFGILSSLIGLISVFAIMGLTKGNIKYGSIYYSRKNESSFLSLFNSSFGLSGFVSTILSIILYYYSDAIATLYFKDIVYSSYLKIYSIGILLASSLAISKSFLNSIQKNEITVYTVIGQKLLNVGVVLLIIVFFGTINLDTFILINLISTSIVILFNIFLLFRLTGYSIRNIFKSLIKPVNDYWFLSFSILGVEFISSIASYSDKLLLGSMANAKEAGLYIFAFALSGFIVIVSNAFQNIFSPIIATIHEQKKYELMRELYNKVTNWVIIFTLPIFWGLVLFYPVLFNPIFNEFESAYYILIIIVMAKMINAMSSMAYNIFSMIGLQKILLRLTISNTILIISLQYILIPKYGGIGASVPILFTSSIFFLISFIVLKKKVGLQPYNLNTVKALVISAVLFISTYGIINQITNYAWSVTLIIISGFAYLYTIYLFIADSYEKELLKTFINNKLK